MSGKRSRVCPYLGLMEDSATHMGFASNENSCFNSNPPGSPDFSHQGRYCLVAEYDQCELYHAGRKTSMPSEIGAARHGLGTRGKLLFTFVGLLSVTVVLAYFIGWKNSHGDLFPVASNAALETPPPVSIGSQEESTIEIPVSETVPPALEPVLLSTNTVTSGWSALTTFTPLPESTFTPLPSQHGFETVKMPASSTQGYLVHVVAAGETLDVIADRYNTTVKAIIAVNYELKPPVWAQYPIVIPVGAKAASGMPAFDVYVVETDEPVAAEALAETLGVEKTALQYYNLCTEDCKFTKGDVLLIPYIK